MLHPQSRLSGWLEPMLREIENDPRAITFPQLDWGNPGPEWRLNKGGIGCTLGFLWNPLSEHEVAEQPRDKVCTWVNGAQLYA